MKTKSQGRFVLAVAFSLSASASFAQSPQMPPPPQGYQQTNTQQGAYCYTAQDCAPGQTCKDNHCAAPVVQQQPQYTPPPPQQQYQQPPPQQQYQQPPPQQQYQQPPPQQYQQQTPPQNYVPPAQQQTPAVTPETPPTPEQQKGMKAWERNRGAVGFGTFGSYSVPVGFGAPEGDTNNPDIAPIGSAGFQAFLPTVAVGARYWTSASFGPVRSLGIEGALGFNSVGSGSTSEAPGQPTASDANPSTFAALIHVGVPLALGGSENATIFVSPEINLGFASGVVKQPTGVTAPPASLSGSLFDIGVRGGAEVYFGFIGLPNLAVEGSVRAALQTTSSAVSVGGRRESQGASTFTTSLNGTPFDFFFTNVAAKYYF